MKSQQTCQDEIGNAVGAIFHIMKHNLKPEALTEVRSHLARIEACLHEGDPPPVDLNPLCDHLTESVRRLKMENLQLKVAMRLR